MYQFFKTLLLVAGIYGIILAATGKPVDISSYDASHDASNAASHQSHEGDPFESERISDELLEELAFEDHNTDLLIDLTDRSLHGLDARLPAYVFIPTLLRPPCS